jgi:hypothetical protein
MFLKKIQPDLSERNKNNLSKRTINNQVEEDEMGGPCSTNGGEE